MEQEHYLAFGPFHFDGTQGRLWQGAQSIALRPQSLALLRYLVEHADRLVTQEELLNALWPETYVQPEVLRTYILDLRKALGDRASQPRFIRTFPKRGYEFLPAVAEERFDAPEDPGRAVAARPDPVHGSFPSG